MHTSTVTLKDLNTFMRLAFALLVFWCFLFVNTASAQSDDSCASIKSYFDGLVASIPNTGVCNNAYTENYVCRDFARDECNALRRAKRKAWKLSFGYDSIRPNGTRGFPSQPSALTRCAWKLCGADQSICHKYHGSTLKNINDCISEKFKYTGHVVVTTEITDATAARLGLHVFAVYEPQDPWSTPGKLLCVWKQEGPNPTLTPDCKKMLREYLIEGLLGHEECTDLSVNFKHHECNEPTGGDPTPSPTPTLVKPPRGW